MISNNCNNFSVDGGLPRKNGRYKSHHARSASAHDAVYCPFFRGIPPSTEKLLQSFLKSWELFLVSFAYKPVMVQFYEDQIQFYEDWTADRKIESQQAARHHVHQYVIGHHGDHLGRFGIFQIPSCLCCIG